MYYSIPGLDGYFGGKGSSGVHQQIINKIPPHDVLIVPFLGHCYITRTIKPAKRTIAHELDENVFTSWRNYTPGSISYYDYFETNNHKGNNILEVHNSCGVQYLENLAAANTSQNCVIYLDAPYLLSTRLSSSRYNYELSTKDHERYLHATLKIDKPTLISHYQNDLYDDFLKGWNRISFNSQTRSGKPAVESLYFNFEPPTKLHDYRFLGDNYKQREHYKLKAERLVSKFKNMTDLERNYYTSVLTSNGFKL